MADSLMFLALGCVVIVAITYRVRRDITGPGLTAVSEVASWVSLGALLLWLAADWLTGSTDQWFTMIPGAASLAAIELACVAVMTVDTFRQRPRRGSAGRHRQD